MRLKSIKLNGFKSFVDPTTINFPSSLCAVVGPNGCGKSNVIDAVRWVMGESSAKNLRGEHMSDVIFNGSSARKPVGQASVELIFDNSDRKLAGEYANFTEVSIKRKVDREGISTYALNGTRCRRRDITDIFLGTGLGARSYSIIEQGMVTRLIESKPEELRVYIEEAAGISKYKERRKETESRIKRTRGNLERLADIRDELGRQLQHLKRQSVAAEKYGGLKQQERETTANLNALRWRSLDGEIKANQGAINSLELDIESASANQSQIDAKVENHLADNAVLTDSLGQVQARFYSLGNDIARIEQSIEHHIERVDQLKQDLTETEEGWTETREELDLDLRKITLLDSELRSISPKLETAQTNEQDSATQLADAEEVLEKWQIEWDEFIQRAEEPRQIAEVEQSRIQQLESVVGRALERKQKLEKEQLSLEQEPVDKNLSDAAMELGNLETEIESLRAASIKLASQIDEGRRSLNLCLEELDTTRGELQTARGKQSSLEALQQAALGQDNQAVNTWLKHRGLDNQVRLGEGLKIQAGWELAVETVLGESIQSICIEGLDKVDELLKELPQGTLSFIDVSSGTNTENSKKQQLKPLASKVSSDWELSGLLAGIYVAEELSQAISLRDQLDFHESIITAEGIWLGRTWIQIRSKSTKDSIVERGSYISDLTKKINNLTNISDKLLNKRDMLGSSLKKNEEQREKLQGGIATRTQELGELRSSMTAQQTKAEEETKRKQRIKTEIQEITSQLVIEEENTQQARGRLQKALDSMAEDVGGREELENLRQKAQKTVAKYREKAIKDKDLSHELALKNQSMQAQLQSTRETMDRMASQVQRSKERMESLTSQIEESDEPLGKMRSDLETLLQQRLEVEKELGVAKSKVDENEHTIRDLERSRNEIQSQLNKLRESLMQKRLKNEGASVKRDGVLQQLKEAKFELPSVLENLPDDLEELECETELEKLSNRIQRLGPINLAAIDEYEEQSERKVYLDKHNEDLEKALKTLQNAIRKIDKETRTRFKDTFDKINTGLQNLFPRVFGGGHAYLDMTGEDLLDTGVAIMARPPGKRNSTIHLLSGGEKAMTAIALVFSIFHLNPSPFCMLDEVDAPLDDANVVRYANLVKEMADYVQFIFITHNKITMEMAKQLQGVTMHEAGVSRIVAVDIDEAAELAAI